MKKMNLNLALLLSSCLVLSACGRDMNDLESYIGSVKARKASTIEPLPTIKEHPKYAYQSGLSRSPRGFSFR